MSITSKILKTAAGAALFAAGYMCGCAGAGDQDYRIFRDNGPAGFEQAYLQDKRNTSAVYEVIRTEKGLKLNDYRIDISIIDADKVRIMGAALPKSRAGDAFGSSIEKICNKEGD